MHTPRTPRTLVVATSLALLLAGCAGGDGAGDTTAGVAAAPADETTQAAAPATGAPTAEDDAAPVDVVADDAEAEGAADSSEDHDEMHDEMAADDHDDAHGDTEDHDDDVTAQDVDRVVDVDMQDIAFSAEQLQFTVGERVRFVFENTGAAPHEALIGDLHLQEEHETDMAEGNGHDDGGHHGDMSMISLEPGETGELVHEFTEPGEFWIGCHVPGHWDAGMRTSITVTS